MKKIFIILVMILIEVAVLSSRSLAAGFSLPDQDAAAMGMAGAFAGQADNPSAVWYNPAGITQLEGTRMSAGVIAIYPVMQHENASVAPGTTDVSERQVFLPVQLFVTNKMNDNLSFGLGITSPFGLSTDWSETSATSRVATFSRIKTIDVNPNLAYKVNDSLSVALGIDYIKLQATMEKMLAPDVLFRLDGEGSGWGANAGLKYKASDQLDFGLSYRSRVKVKVDDATANVTAYSLSNPVQTEITLPDLIEAGISYKVSETFNLNTDLDYTWWSTYDRLILKSDTILALTTMAGSPTDTSIDEKNWKNTWTLRIGGQYRLSDPWKLRVGYVYDQSPVPSDRFDTRVPDSDRQGVTIGAGYASGNITLDVSYMYLHFNTRTISNTAAGGSSPVASLNGTYKAEAHLAAVTIGYKF